MGLAIIGVSLNPVSETLLAVLLMFTLVTLFRALLLACEIECELPAVMVFGLLAGFIVYGSSLSNQPGVVFDASVFFVRFSLIVLMAPRA